MRPSSSMPWRLAAHSLVDWGRRPYDGNKNKKNLSIELRWWREDRASTAAETVEAGQVPIARHSACRRPARTKHDRLLSKCPQLRDDLLLIALASKQVWVRCFRRRSWPWEVDSGRRGRTQNTPGGTVALAAYTCSLHAKARTQWGTRTARNHEIAWTQLAMLDTSSRRAALLTRKPNDHWRIDWFWNDSSFSPWQQMSAQCNKVKSRWLVFNKLCTLGFWVWRRES